MRDRFLLLADGTFEVINRFDPEGALFALSEFVEVIVNEVEGDGLPLVVGGFGFHAEPLPSP